MRLEGRELEERQNAGGNSHDRFRDVAVSGPDNATLGTCGHRLGDVISGVPDSLAWAR